MKTLLIIFFTNLIYVTSVGATSIWTNKQIYDATKEACSVTTEEQAFGLTLETDQLRAGRFRSPKFNRLIIALQSTAFREAFLELNYSAAGTDTMSFIQDNPAFEKALSECYPQNPRMVLFFKKAVFKADRQGKIVSAVLTTALLTVGPGLITRLGRAGKYINNVLNFSAISGAMAGAYHIYRESVATKTAQENICPTTQNINERANCFKQSYLDGIAKIKEISSSQEKTNQVVQKTLIKLAQEQIVQLKIKLVAHLGEKKEKEIRALIKQREDFILSNNP